MTTDAGDRPADNSAQRVTVMDWYYHIARVWDDPTDRVVWEDVYLRPADPEYRGESLWLTIDAFGDASDPTHGDDRAAFQEDALRKLGAGDSWIDGGAMIVRVRDFNQAEVLQWARVWLERQGFPVAALLDAPREAFAGTNAHARLIDAVIGDDAPERPRDEDSVSITRELGDRQAEAEALTNLGLVYHGQGRWEDAIHCCEESLAICRALGEREGEGITLFNLGTVYDEQGRWAEALRCYEDSLLIRRTLGNRQGEGRILTNLGVVYQRQGRWAEARRCYEESLVICRALGDRQGEGQALYNLGIVYHEQGEGDKAVAVFRDALATLHPDSPEYRTLASWLDEQGFTRPHGSPEEDRIVMTCTICHFPTELDDVALCGPAGQCVCLTCYDRETGAARPMPRTLRRQLSGLLAALESVEYPAA